MSVHTRSGFTLIETLVYMGLLAFIMGSMLIVVYQIIESNSKSQVKIDVREEGNFLMEKLEGGMNGASLINVIGVNTLSIIRPSGNITFTFSGQALNIKRGSGTMVALNSANIVLSSSSFKYMHSTTSTAPDEVTANFTLTEQTYAQDFSFTKYIRK
jgi:type II secretory pathway pseudopilin PulG